MPDLLLLVLVAVVVMVALHADSPLLQLAAVGVGVWFLLDPITAWAGIEGVPSGPDAVVGAVSWAADGLGAVAAWLGGLA